MVSLSRERLNELVLPEGEGIESGGVVVSSLGELAGFLRFRNATGAVTSVQDSPVSDAFAVPVSSQIDRVGLAVYNADEEDLTVDFRLAGRSAQREIPVQGKMAQFVDELFPGPGEITGQSLIVRAPGRITVLALELVGSSLVTLPAVALD